MRTTAFLLPLLMFAAPASAQPIEIPSEMTDPAMVEKLGAMVDALSEALLELPVGEIEAAAEGRPLTPADKGKKVRDVADAAELERQVAQARPMIEHSIKALSRTLPAIAKSLSGAAAQVERAVGNMPRPDYPRR